MTQVADNETHKSHSLVTIQTHQMIYPWGLILPGSWRNSFKTKIFPGVIMSHMPMLFKVFFPARISVYFMCTWCPGIPREAILYPGTSHRQLWAAMWGAEHQLWSSGGEVYALNSWAISPFPWKTDISWEDWWVTKFRSLKRNQVWYHTTILSEVRIWGRRIAFQKSLSHPSTSKIT